MPTGTLISSTDRQPSPATSPLTRTPPRIGPATAAIPEIAPNMP